MQNTSTFITLLIAILITSVTHSEVVVNNTGIPFVKNFHRSEYQGGTQTWSISQDQRGLIYFANNDGVLEYDGIHWRKYPMPNSSIVRSVYKSSDGNLYIGAYNELGYFKVNSSGNLYYHSLTALVDNISKDFGEIWSIQDSKEGILFQSFSTTLLLKDGIISIIQKDQDLNYAYVKNGNSLMGNNDKGLQILDGKSIKDIEGFEHKTLSGVEMLDENTYLLGSSYHGFFTLNNNKIKHWNTEASSFIQKNQLYSLIKAEDNLYVAGTINSGIIFFDAKGDIIRHIDKKSGLQNNSVLSLMLDHDKNLWIGLDNGIDMISLASPVSMLFTRDKYGAGYISAEHDSKLYFGTNHGLYYAPQSSIINARQEANLIPIDQLMGQTWNLQVINNKLICGHHNGAYQVEGNEVTQISDIRGYWRFVPLNSEGKYFIASNYTGIALFEYKADSYPNFTFIKQYEGFHESCRLIEVDKSGNIWLSNPYKGIFQIKLSDDFNQISKLEIYDHNNGLPSDFQNTIFLLEDELLVFSETGVYTYDEVSNRFEPNAKMTNILGKEKVNRVSPDKCGNIWYFQNNTLGLLRSDFKGLYEAEQVPYNELKRDFIKGYENTSCVYNNSLIIGTEYGFIHFDKSKTTQHNNEQKVIIRRVSAKDGTPLFNGNYTNHKGQIVTKNTDEPTLTLPYHKDYLKFEVSSLSYSETDHTQYSFRLEGYDNEWSNYSSEPEIIYSKLKRGIYTLNIKSRNHLGDESDTATYHFIIKPAWYWNGIAISIYAMTLCGLIYLIYRMIGIRINEQKEALEIQNADIIRKKEKEFEYENLRKEQEIIKLRNQNLSIENDRNQVEIENKTKELAAIVMKISSVNEFITRTKDKLGKVHQNMVHEESKKQVATLVKHLDAELTQQDDWKQFEIHFDQVHENFINALRSKYPRLTVKDLKMAAYLRMNMSSKEIAQLFNMTYRGVETSRFRLRKKLNLPKEKNLTKFLMSFNDEVE